MQYPWINTILVFLQVQRGVQELEARGLDRGDDAKLKNVIKKKLLSAEGFTL